MRVITTMITMLLVSLLLFPVMTFAAVEQPIHLFMNGKELAAEVAPRIIKGNTLVPVRIIAESVGSKVQWDEKIRQVTVVKADVTIQLVIDKSEALVNNKKTILEAAPQIIDGNTLLPVRFVSEQFGVKVSWDDLTRSVFLFQPEVQDDVKETVSSPVSNNDGKPVVKEPTEESGKPNPDSGQQPNSSIVDKPSTGQENDPTKVDKPKDTLTTIRSITLEGDVLSVQTSGPKAVANVTSAVGSNQIVIDIPYGQLDPALKLNAKGEGSVKENNNNVSQIRYLLFSKESSIVRIIIDSTKKLDLKPVAVKPTSAANTLAWTITPQTSQQNKFKVVIDPGHGGKDTGAVSLTKRYEKDFVLSLGTKVYKLLEQEPRIEPHMTRSTDNFIELADRAAFANDMKADIFVSIHGNSASKESVRGTETYYYTEQSLAFANLMHEQLLNSAGFPDRKVKQNNFYVVKNTTMPSLLLEVGFLSNHSDEEAMYSDAFQNQVAASIVAGIKKQLKID